MLLFVVLGVVNWPGLERTCVRISLVAAMGMIILWPFAFITLMVMSNLTGSVLMYRVTLYWVLYMVVFLSLRIWAHRYSALPDGLSELAARLTNQSSEWLPSTTLPIEMSVEMLAKKTQASYWLGTFY